MASRVAWEIGDETEPNDSDLTSFYSGPTPPAGTYLCTMKWLRLSKQQNNTVPRFMGPCEISEPEGSPNEQYNGYTIWIGQGFDDHPRSKAHIRSLVLALGATWQDVLKKTITDLKRGEEFSKERPAEVLKIGPVEIGDNELVVVTNPGTDQNGNAKLEPVQYLPPDEYEEAEWDEDDEKEPPPPPKKRAAKKAAPPPEEEEYDDDLVDDDEEEPPPPKRRAAKKAPAKPILDDEDFEDDDEDEAPPPRKRAAKKAAPAKRAPAGKKTAARRRTTADDYLDDNDPPF